MEEIKIYKCKDGQRFDLKDNAIKYEKLIDDVEEVISKLPEQPKDDGCRFSNGHGYLQHKSIDIMIARKELLELALKNEPGIDKTNSWVRESISNHNHHISYAQRIIGEYNSLSPISRALYRLACIDSKNREFGQPYFANNPEKADLFQLNVI